MTAREKFRVEDNARGAGATTQQMQRAAQGAVFVWCNNHLAYPRALAKHLCRDDLEIVGPGWLEDRAWEGRWLTEMVIDHAAQLTDRQFRGMKGVMEQLPRAGKGCRES